MWLLLQCTLLLDSTQTWFHLHFWCFVRRCPFGFKSPRVLFPMIFLPLSLGSPSAHILFQASNLPREVSPYSLSEILCSSWEGEAEIAVIWILFSIFSSCCSSFGYTKDLPFWDQVVGLSLHLPPLFQAVFFGQVQPRGETPLVRC